MKVISLPSGIRLIPGLCLILALSSLFIGCLPNNRGPILPQDIPDRFAHELEVSDLPMTTSLLALFKENRLKELVNRALEGNPDLKATALRLEASDHQLWQTRSRLMPQADLRVRGGRDNHGIDPVAGTPAGSSRYRLGLGIGWEMDVWGKLANEHGAQLARFENRKQLYQAAYDSLSARVIQTWIRAAGAHRTLMIQQRRIQTLKKIEKNILRRYRHGLGSLDELATARTRTIVAQADISRLKEERAREIRGLDLLLGTYPGTTKVGDYTIPEITMPQYNIPLTVLNRRPDVKAALAAVKSDKLMALAAHKKRLPGVNLSYDLSKQATSISSFGSRDLIYSLALGMVQPLFSGGRLKHEALAADLEADASIQTLKGVILKALNEVEDRYGRERDLGLQEAHLTAALAQARKSRGYFKNRYKDGLETIQALLIAVEQEMNINTRLIAVRTQRMNNRIDLALATGAGA